ncbi:BC1872 family protein [Bacillus cereus group sp. BfR-BA-01380]|uniref:BC1872 family protein n=1 Tax=Bacillus cereus group sp. BfR-BA-01380 TaxID=2920324 RepID=UPI001F56AA08|nr:hypothetical protein [Bacillus cereus group sp. BfR-BA-01380]
MENRELNILIAEKIMGWKVAVAIDGVTEYYDNGTLCDGKWVDDVGILEKDNLNVFKPTEKIQDAWQVVEKLEYDVKVTKTDLKPKYQVHVFVPGDVKMVFAETAPMAICKGALEVIKAQNQN